jgi:phenylalanyl-tRNA synthetase beta chain
MLIPLSWLKEFVEINLPLKDLMWKMTEAGLTCESFEERDGDIILDVEVTPNRPDWMSVVGIAREVAAITGAKLSIPKVTLETKNVLNPLQIKIDPDYKVAPRITSVIIRNVTVKPSPDWLQKRILQIGLRPINNLVDITNYVLWTYGALLHVFDYDKILNHQMTVELSKGGEEFRSLDGIDYILPKGAIVIKDNNRVIDLLPLKGGENTASYTDTKNVLLHSIICDPIITRHTSQSLKLRSDSSAIAERGLDPNGTITAVNHAASLILELAGGALASNVIDHKKTDFKPWKLSLSLTRLEKVLGVKLPDNDIVNILTRLGLDPLKSKDLITCTIPTYRADLTIEEDLIEEVARLYGYNKFPKTIPTTTTPTVKLPYYFDRKFILNTKELLVSSGFTEVMNLSLISKDLIDRCKIDSNKHIKLANPVSREYEYLRGSLVPSLIQSSKLNNDARFKLFELDKVYTGTPGKTNELYKLSAIARGLKFREFKGVIDLLLERLDIESYKIEFETKQSYWHPFKAGSISFNKSIIGEFGELHPQVLSNFSIKEPLLMFELDISTLERLKSIKVYKSVPDYPAQIEDLTINFPDKTRIGEVVNEIKSSHKFISNVELGDIYNSAYTFRIWYQSPDKTLENSEIENIRKVVTQNLQKKYGGRVR